MDTSEDNFTPEPREFGCYLARGLRNPLSYTGKPTTRDQHFEVARWQAEEMSPRLAGIPFHPEHDESITMGEVTEGSVDASGDWPCKFRLFTHNSKAALVMASLIDVGYIKCVSLSHIRNGLRPKELTGCYQGARDGAIITSGQLPYSDSTNIQLNKRQQEWIASSRSVRASAGRFNPDHFLGSDLVIANNSELVLTQEEAIVKASNMSSEATQPPAAAAAPLSESGPFATLFNDFNAAAMEALPPKQRDEFAKSMGVKQPAAAAVPVPTPPPPPIQQLTSPPAAAAAASPSPPQADQKVPEVTPENSVESLVNYALQNAKSDDDKEFQTATAARHVITRLAEETKAKNDALAAAAIAQKRVQELEATAARNIMMNGVAANMQAGHVDPQRAAEMKEQVNSGLLDRAAQHSAQHHRRASASAPPPPPPPSPKRNLTPQQEADISHFANMMSAMNAMRGSQPGPTPSLNADPIAASNMHSSSMYPPQRLATPAAAPPPPPPPPKIYDADNVTVRASTITGLCATSNEGFSIHHDGFPIGRKVAFIDYKYAEANSHRIAETVRASLKFDFKSYQSAILPPRAGGAAGGGGGAGAGDFTSVLDRPFSMEVPHYVPGVDVGQSSGWGNVVKASGATSFSASHPPYSGYTGGGGGGIRDTTTGRHVPSQIISGDVNLPPLSSFPPFIDRRALADLGCTVNASIVTVTGEVTEWLPSLEKRKAAGPSKFWGPES